MNDPLLENVWEESPEYPRSDWKDEVNNDDTNLGYWDWVEHQIESNDEDILITCALCGNSAVSKTAHLHQEQYIGDECCWDERLKSSE